MCTVFVLFCWPRYGIRLSVNPTKLHFHKLFICLVNFSESLSVVRKQMTLSMRLRISPLPHWLCFPGCFTMQSFWSPSILVMPITFTVPTLSQLGFPKNRARGKDFCSISLRSQVPGMWEGRMKKGRRKTKWDIFDKNEFTFLWHCLLRSSSKTSGWLIWERKGEIFLYPLFPSPIVLKFATYYFLWVSKGLICDTKWTLLGLNGEVPEQKAQWLWVWAPSRCAHGWWKFILDYLCSHGCSRNKWWPGGR
jgi:hypothetical protein